MFGEGGLFDGGRDHGEPVGEEGLDRLLLGDEGKSGVEIALRLRQAGIRTLGQLARLDELALRRQFGAVGALLAALRFRTRFTTTLTVEQTLRRLPGLASAIATRLHGLNQTMGALTLTVRWASGGVERSAHTFPDPIRAASVIAQRLMSLLTSLARPQSMRSARQSSDIERLDVRVSSLAPLRPQQRALWATPQHARSERRRRIAALAEQLAQRYRRPALLTLRQTHGAATFSEERYMLAPFTIRADLPRPPAPARPHEQAREARVEPHWW